MHDIRLIRENPQAFDDGLARRGMEPVAASILALDEAQTKKTLDCLKRLCVGRDLPDQSACTRFDKATRNGKDMRGPQKLLATAVGSIVGKTEERAISSLFTPGGTHAMKGEFAGKDDFEVAAFFVVLPEPEPVRGGK